jgi:uncharacterized protein YhaN
VKLHRLHINNFGHFADCDIEFPADGLQVIYGPNEAGKTTLLEFLRGWLFDFPARTPYDFKAGTEIAGVGTLTLGDGRSVELRRRKGNKNKVSVKIDGLDTDLDETGFQRLIGNANRSLFESVFAFGLDQLSRGEETLKHESLQSALFGGGLGSAASPERIQQELERQAAELFSPTARKPTINVLLGEMKELAARIKSKTLRSDEFLKCRQAVADADARASELHQRVDQLRREHARVEKLVRAWSKWNELRQRTIERAPLSVAAGLPADARTKAESVAEKLQACDEDSDRLTSDLTALDRDLAALRLDPRAVSYRADIRVCLELRQSFVEAKRDLPRLKLEHDAARRTIDVELNDLRRGWTHDDLRTFSIDAATRAEIDSLIEADRNRATARAELRAKQEQLKASVADAERELKSLGQPRDVSALSAALADEAGYASDVKELERNTVEVAKVDRQRTTRFRKLTPPLPAETEAPHALPVPQVETVALFESDFAELRKQLRAASDSAREDEEQLRDLQEKIDEATTGGAVPSLDELASARQRRDETWASIRAQIASGKTFDADAYEQSVRDADDIADRIYANADAVARREELRRQLDLLTRRLTQKQDHVTELQAKDAELQRRWLATWQPCGFEPLAPDAMRRWLTDHDAVCETIARREELDADAGQLKTRIESFETRLRAVSENADAGIAVLLAAAHHAVDEAKEQQRRTKELTRDLQRLKPQLEECDDELAAVDERERAWRDDWQSLLSRLNLPTEWTTELARTVIERLSATRVKLDGLPQEEARLAAMQSRLDEFRAKVQPLCETLDPELLRDEPEVAAEKLSDQLDRAAEAQKQHDQLCKQRDATRDQLDLVQDRRKKLAAEQTALFAAAEVSTADEFLEVVSRAETIRKLDADIERLTREIDLIRAAEDRDEFEQSLSRVEPEVLDGQRRDLADQLQTTERQKKEADGAAAVAKSELDRLDGSDEAAVLTDGLSRKRSQLAAEVDRYVPLVFARHLLGEAVRRFERENQPEMIATVSRLIGQMTGGRYTEFDRTTGSSQGILVRRYDGVERSPDQLSTGTREQLHLAIRLAYVLHYCRQNEPLPIVMDDVLVNFDYTRARQTIAALADVATSVQVLFFTCHPHMVKLAQEAVRGLTPIELPTMPSQQP